MGHGLVRPVRRRPLSADELRQLGVFWQSDLSGMTMRNGRVAPTVSPADVFVTRLHVRYDQAHFPEDLVFHETGDRTNFQGRYVLRHAYTGPATCETAEAYRRELGPRREREAQALASLTGWRIEDIRRRQGVGPIAPAPAPADVPVAWWRKLWKQ